MMDQADSKGRLVYRGETDKGKLRMGFSLVLLQEDGVGESGPLVTEEIFGPVLPIIPYSVSLFSDAYVWIKLTEGIRVSTPLSSTSTMVPIHWRYTCALPRKPFGNEVCGSPMWSIQRLNWVAVVAETRSGSACWNDFAFPTFGKDVSSPHAWSELMSIAARALPFGGVGASGCKLHSFTSHQVLKLSKTAHITGTTASGRSRTSKVSVSPAHVSLFH